MSAIQDMFGEDSSDEEQPPTQNIGEGGKGGGDIAGHDGSDSDDPVNTSRVSQGEEISGADDPLADSDSDDDIGDDGNDRAKDGDANAATNEGMNPAPSAGMNVGSEEDLGAASLARQRSMQEDVFGLDSDSDDDVGGDGRKRGEGGDSVDPFDEDDENEDAPAAKTGKTLRRLQKNTPKKTKGNRKGKRKLSGEDGVGQEPKKGKGKRKGKGKSKAGKEEGAKRRRHSREEGGGGHDPAADGERGRPDMDGGEAVVKDLGQAENGSDEEEYAETRTKEDDDFIDHEGDDADLIAEYGGDPAPAGSDSEAEEDNDTDPKGGGAGRGRDRGDMDPENPMNAVLKAMRRRKAQVLGTAEREAIVQEFLFKMNSAAEDDEAAVRDGRPALNKLKLRELVKSTLAKKDLQESFLEFDLLGVVKRWLQPYPNGSLPNITVRKDMLAMVSLLPVQIDHLRRSGLGRVVMGLLNCKEETQENKTMLRELVHRWNRPIYEKETNYRALKGMREEPELDPVQQEEKAANMAVAAARRKRGGGVAVGNILQAGSTSQAVTGRSVPYSTGYAFEKAPASKLKPSQGRQGLQQESTRRATLLKKISTLAKPVSKGGTRSVRMSIEGRGMK